MLSSEREAIELVLSGQKDAFSTLVSLYEKTVFNIAYRITRDREGAVDIAQETFIQAYKKLPLFRKGSPFRPWICRIAHNLSLNYKKRATHRVTPITGVSELLANSGSLSPGPEDSALQKDTTKLLEQVKKEVENLPDIERNAITLKYIKELSIKEISQILSAPVNTIKTHLFRGREKVRKRLKWWFQ